MANEQNLRPFTSEQSREEAKKNGRKGGIASGEAKRRAKTLRQELEILLSEEITDRKGKKQSIQTAISSAIIKKALAGDIRAYEIIRDTIGEKPVEKIMQADVDPSIMAEVEEMVRANDKD